MTPYTYCKIEWISNLGLSIYPQKKEELIRLGTECYFHRQKWVGKLAKFLWNEIFFLHYLWVVTPWSFWGRGHWWGKLKKTQINGNTFHLHELELTVKTSVLPKWSIETMWTQSNPNGILYRNRKKKLKFVWNYRRLQIVKAVLSKNKGETSVSLITKLTTKLQ